MADNRLPAAKCTQGGGAGVYIINRDSRNNFKFNII